MVGSGSLYRDGRHLWRRSVEATASWCESAAFALASVEQLGAVAADDGGDVCWAGSPPAAGTWADVFGAERASSVGAARNRIDVSTTPQQGRLGPRRRHRAGQEPQPDCLYSGLGSTTMPSRVLSTMVTTSDRSC